MKETLDMLTKIKETLGCNKCDVVVFASEPGGIIIRVSWCDGSNYHLQRIFTKEEINNITDSSFLIDYFIEWAIFEKNLFDSNLIKQNRSVN